MPKVAMQTKKLGKVFLQHYLDKHDALNHSAADLTKAGRTFIAARNLHK